MNLKHITLLLLFSIYLVLVHSVSPQIAHGLYEGRSSDIIISPKTLVEDDSFMILNIGESRYQKDTIEDVEVADLVSHFLGTQPLSQNSRSALPPLDPFTKPRANLLITIEALGDETVSSLPSGQKLKLKKTVYPASISSVLNTLATGETPSLHGIVADSWKNGGETVQAHSENGQTMLSNYADLLSQSYDGRSLTLSVSLDARAAHAFAAHKQTLSARRYWNNARVTYDQTSKTAGDRTNGLLSTEFDLSRESLVEALKSVPFVQVVEDKVIVTLPNQQSVEFSLNAKEDAELLMELGLSQGFVEKLKMSPTLEALTTDEFPDSYAVIFKSLESVQDSYSPDSDQVRVARALIQAQAANIAEQLNNLYSNRLASETVFLGSSAQSSYASLRERLPAHLVSKESFPHVFTSHEAHEETCQTLKFALADSDFEVHCARDARHLFTRQAVNGDDDDNMDLMYFQSILWGILIWLIAVYLIVQAMAGINGGKDTMLYRSTTRSHQHAQ
eukprot:TRINITY_DN7672_c0_g1_i1.p1 TRINITY_DN7672_c0_g1~~TRINITY_DN7672_c0_g1_i1.p1  ORF type:complete len:505 (+),score=99.42 TRINITY_DN7672_c0_g1_i1:92-1606(+)